MTRTGRAALIAIAAACAGRAAPASWPVPAGWRAEVIPFPLDFAPALAHRGVEVIRFAPGFFDPAAPGYWSYAFAWRLDDVAALDATALAGELTAYFRGLVAAVDDKHRVADDARAQIVAHAEPVPAAAGAAATFVLTAHVVDAFTTARPVELVGAATRRACTGGGALWTFTLAPAASSSGALARQLAELARAASCDSIHR